jgi:iron complex transport system permease protein
VTGLATPARLAALVAVLGALLVVAFAVGLGVGPSGLELAKVWEALRGADAGVASDIVLRVRLPRVVLAALVGASLATSGTLFQALLRNPLADPYVLGVSGGAALGAIVVLALGGVLGLGYQAVPPASFAGAIATLLLLFAVAGRSGRLSFASAAIVFLASSAGLTEGARIFVWLIGNLSDARFDVAGLVALFLALGLAASFPFARSLNLLALGEEPAAQLGVPVEGVRRLLLVATSLMVGAAVSVSGLIGFVGLIIPHLLRLAIGPDHRLLIPAAALGGASFLVFCDTAARTVLAGRELPVGAITALVGGPLFLFLLRRAGAGTVWTR